VAATIARAIPKDASVSASPALVPRLSQRARLYVFPAVLDADHIFVDVTESLGATSPGDVYLRLRSLLAEGTWRVDRAIDGILLLSRGASDRPLDIHDLPPEFYSFARQAPDASASTAAGLPAGRWHLGGSLELLGAEVMASPDGAIGPEGPLGRLRTVWHAHRPIAEGSRLQFELELETGQRAHVWDLPAIWWYPPERWAPGERVQIEIPRVPLATMAGWSVRVEGAEREAAAWPGVATPLPQSPTSDRSFRVGAMTLRVHVNPWRMSLLDPAGRLVWEEAWDYPLGFRMAGDPRRTARHLLAAAPLGPDAVRLVAATDDPEGRLLTIEARSLAPTALRLTVAASEPAGVQAVGGAIIARPDERFVGFGERFTGVNQRGRRIDIWAADRVLADYGDTTYAPLPLVFSSQGYGFALESYERARFDVAASRPDQWSWEQDAGRTSILLTFGPALKELLQLQAQVLGTPPRPPIWAFGVWKTATGGVDHVLHEARRLRELQVPVSAVFTYDALDAAANIGWPDVRFAGRWAGSYPDHASFTAELHHLGFKALAYFSPDFRRGGPSYDEPAGLDLLAKRSDGSPYVDPRFSISWLDFTKRETHAWWAKAWRRSILDLGYDGGMLDMGEVLPSDAVLADGTTGATTHNRYPLLYAQSAWEHASRLRPDDFVLFARSGALGAHRFQSLQWRGDARMEWGAPAGLQSLVPAALSVGLSGFPYWHAEVAGFAQAGLSPEQERELWLRWLQLATWTATLRDNYGDHPSSPIDFWRDDSTIGAYREAARIHNSLVPYLYTSVVEASALGLPLMRFLPLEVPDDPRAWREEQSYFLGPLLLVAPVIEPGATSRTVYLPSGEWADFWTDQVYRGGQEVTVPAPLDGGRAPVFVRAGALLPLAPPFDSLVPSQDPSIRTYSGDLVVRIAAGGRGPSTFTLYDGTQLSWDGATALSVVANAQPRYIELRLPGGSVATQFIDGATGEVRVR
jgi:alpha-glucosidase (family GH31 glycosyl hydrolase)